MVSSVSKIGIIICSGDGVSASGGGLMICRGFTCGVKVLYSHDTLFGVLLLDRLALGVIVRFRICVGSLISCDVVNLVKKLVG